MKKDSPVRKLANTLYGDRESQRDRTSSEIFKVSLTSLQGQKRTILPSKMYTKNKQKIKNKNKNEIHNYIHNAINVP